MGTTQKHYLKINPYLDIISGITVVLSFSDGIIKIIGREGSGKSVLTQLLAADLMEEEQEVVIFSDVPHSEPELHDPIQQQLHLDLGESTDFYAALNTHIQARPFDQQKLILVFDDADQIPDDCFDAIRVLFEKNYHDRPEVSMVFAGTELLDEKLNEPQNRTFNKNIILNFEVKPMSRGELEAFCNAYLVEMGLQQKHQLSAEDINAIYQETRGLPGKIPELIFAAIDREEEEKAAARQEEAEEKSIIKKLVALDDDPEPEIKGLSVDHREDVLVAYKEQVPWRWQSNGVGIAVVVLMTVVLYGYFVPAEERTSSIVIIPPPQQSPGQFTTAELTALAETLVQQSSNQLSQVPVEESATETPEETATELVAGVEEPAGQPEPETTVTEPTPEPAVPISEEPEETVMTAPDDEEEETEAEIAATEVEIEEPAVPEQPQVAQESPEPAEEVAEAGPQPGPVTEPGSEPVAETQAVADTGQAIDPEPASEPEPVPEPELVAEPEPVQVATNEEPVAAPVPAATAVGPQSASQRPRTGALTFISNWLAAWEAQDTADYFDAYSAQYTPTGAGSRNAWMNDRSSAINRPSSIRIDMEDFEILSESGDESTVRLQFTYTSPTYADRTTKELQLAVENGDWVIVDERNIAIEPLAAAASPSMPIMAASAGSRSGISIADPREGESGYEAKIRQVLSLVDMPDPQELNTPTGMFINEWLRAWKNQDVEGYFRHYHDNFDPANFDSLRDWRADRIRKINEKRFIEIAFDDIQVIDEDQDSTRIRFWISYASSFYLDRTLKEVVLASGEELGILEERNLEVEIIPFYPFPYNSVDRAVTSLAR